MIISINVYLLRTPRVSSLSRPFTTLMSRRSQPPSPESSPRIAKKPRLEYPPLTAEDYKNGLMLAPMVRSGACEDAPGATIATFC